MHGTFSSTARAETSFIVYDLKHQFFSKNKTYSETHPNHYNSTKY